MSVSLYWRKNPRTKSKAAYLEISEDGTRRRESIGIVIQKNDNDKRQKERKAEAIRTKYHNAMMNRQWDLVDPEKFNFPFLKYCFHFLEHYHRAGKRKYIAAVSSFQSFLEYRMIDEKITCKELTPSICEQYRDYLLQDAGLTGETPYDYFKRFTAIINKAIRERYFIESPVKNVVFKKPQTDVKKQILTIEEIQKLINTDYGNPEVRRAFIFACFTGLGEKEIRNIKWGNVLNNRLNIERAKNGMKVSFKLPKTAQNVLGEPGKSDEFIFDLPSNSRIWRILKKWVEKAGIDKHITFYCARHSFAVMNLKNGANLKTIKDLLGHSTMDNTVKYLNFIDEERDKAMSNLPELDL